MKDLVIVLLVVIGVILTTRLGYITYKYFSGEEVSEIGAYKKEVVGALENL